MALTAEQKLQLQLAVERHLTQLEKVFVKGTKLTLIARLPGNDEADILLTMDDFDEIAKVVERSKRRPNVGAPA